MAGLVLTCSGHGDVDTCRKVAVYLNAPPMEIDSPLGPGWDRFTMDCHTKKWKRLVAKDQAKAYGAVAVGTQWCWYETWLNRVREECQLIHPRRNSSPSARDASSLEFKF
jgi:hypothetical protein